MQISVRTWADQTFTLEVKPSDKIENVKSKILDREGFLPGEYSLVFNENQLEEDGRTLSDLNIQQESNVQMIEKMLRNRTNKLEGDVTVIKRDVSVIKRDVARILQRLDSMASSPWSQSS
ncbi:ubiquitin-like [Tigriopus californicus]|uniref:ubiquitin-like n=1 Tax=Tigriopus californicus TaxID=6832 RepID=UPI0027DA5456|nr:ubiquitin-like [Tigriopus californicus]